VNDDWVRVADWTDLASPGDQRRQTCQHKEGGHMTIDELVTALHDCGLPGSAEVQIGHVMHDMNNLGGCSIAGYHVNPTVEAVAGTAVIKVVDNDETQPSD
jgi:hypothetical protein